LNLEDLFGPKTVLVLLYLVVALTISALQVFMQVDNVVNVDLYRYDLQFTATWAVEYWQSQRIVLGCLFGATAIMSITLIPYYYYSKVNSAVSRWSCLIFPLISAGLAAVSLYFIMQIDSLVNVTLYEYGLQLSQEWATKYLTFTRITLALTESAVILPIIMTLITWNITRD
jgi:hypothetical protein